MKNLRHFILGVFISALLVLSSYAQLTVLPMGKIDRSFGDSGTALIFPGASPVPFGDSCQLPDGNIVLVNNYSSGIGISKLLLNGQLDPSFGNNGTAFFSVAANTRDVGASAVCLPNGKIIIIGSTQTNTAPDSDFLVFRITSTGIMDTSFGSGGYFIKDFRESKSTQASEDRGGSALLLPNGKILVAGNSDRFSDPTQRTDTYASLIRLNEDGLQDSSFGQNGVTQLAIGNDFLGNVVPHTTLDKNDDGSFLVGWTADVNTSSDFSAQGQIVKFSENGMVDPKFADNGRLRLTYGNVNAPTYLLKIKILQGKILALMSFALARLTASGSYDKTFGDAGVKPLPLFVTDFLVQDDQKIIVSGGDRVTFPIPPGYRQIGSVRRMFPDGSPDLYFGISGKTIINFYRGPSPPDERSDIALQRIYPFDSKNVLVTGLYNLPSSFIRLMSTKIRTSK